MDQDVDLLKAINEALVLGMDQDVELFKSLN